MMSFAMRYYPLLLTQLIMGFPSIDTEFLSWAFGRTSLLIGHSPRPPILVRLCAEPRFLVSTGRETKFLLASEGHHKFQLRVTQNSFCGEQYVTRSSAFRIPAHRSLQNGSTTNCSLVRAYPGHAGPHLECVTLGREVRDMNVEVRAFEAADVCAMVRIWNEAVEEGGHLSPGGASGSADRCGVLWRSVLLRRRGRRCELGGARPLHSAPQQRGPLRSHLQRKLCGQLRCARPAPRRAARAGLPRKVGGSAFASCSSML